MWQKIHILLKRTKIREDKVPQAQGASNEGVNKDSHHLNKVLCCAVLCCWVVCEAVLGLDLRLGVGMGGGVSWSLPFAGAHEIPSSHQTVSICPPRAARPLAEVGVKEGGVG